jgi:hypothetical protein
LGVVVLEQVEDNNDGRRGVSPSTQRQNSWTYDFVEVSGHNLGSLSLEVSVNTVYIANQFLNTFARAGGGGGWVKFACM